MQRVFPVSIAAIVAIVSLTLITSAQPTSPKSFPNITIENFGQMDSNLYRGAQPESGSYKALADIGIRTIVDLRNDPTDYEKREAESVGLRYVNIPMSGWRTPRDSDLERFLRIANDPDTGKMFFHCKAGKHRAGVAAAVYRLTKYGWTYDQAYQEMKNYNFYSGLVHGRLKSYVKEYAKKLNLLSSPPAPPMFIQNRRRLVPHSIYAVPGLFLILSGPFTHLSSLGGHSGTKNDRFHHRHIEIDGGLRHRFLNDT